MRRRDLVSGQRGGTGTGTAVHEKTEPLAAPPATCRCPACQSRFFGGVADLQLHIQAGHLSLARDLARSTKPLPYPHDVSVSGVFLKGV